MYKVDGTEASKRGIEAQRHKYFTVVHMHDKWGYNLLIKW